jgi:hypothetical protein
LSKPLEYTDEINTEWSTTAVQTFEVVAAPDHEHPVVLDLSGTCPRCGDHMEHEHWLIAFSGVASMSRDDALHAIEALRDAGVAADSLLPTEFSVQCDCKTPHPDTLGRKGLRGCGAMWKMRFEAVEDAG